MSRPFPVVFGRRAVALVRAGKPISTAAVELGERTGITTPESIELAKAKKRIFAV